MKLMEIRIADLTDLNACTQLDGSFSTEYVWQVQARGDSGEVSSIMHISFHAMRLPRPIDASYPRLSDELISHWQGAGCFLVAVEGKEVKGFIDAQPVIWNETARVSNLIVAPEERRTGTGTMLIEAVADWARSYGLQYLVLEAQTKNVPAIQFYQRNGARFCGFNDHYYPNRDVAVFFSRPV